MGLGGGRRVGCLMIDQPKDTIVSEQNEESGVWIKDLGETAP